jgi:hypothetical protein
VSIHYAPVAPPRDLNDVWLELNRLQSALLTGEIDFIKLKSWADAPAKPSEGVVYYADGTNWNPGHGEGPYVYRNSEWVPLFPLVSGVIISDTSVSNTTTETEIYTTTIAAEELTTGEPFELKVGGYYDTDTASDTWTLRVKINGTAVHSITRQSAKNASAFGWVSKWIATIRASGASGTFVDSSELVDDDTCAAYTDSSGHSIDTTSDLTLSMTIQWGAAKAGNVFVITQGCLSFFHP